MTGLREITNQASARAFLLQGLCLQRVLPPRSLQPALEWALEMASEGMPLPPLCLIADLGHLAFGMDWESQEARALPPVAGVPTELVRMYEDYVVAKAAADWTFQQAGDVLRHYHGRDRARGLAFLINQFRAKAGFGGVALSPAWIKGLFDLPGPETLAQAAEEIRAGSLHPVLESLVRDLVACARRTNEMLTRVDVFELEHRTALNEFSQRLALRQVLIAAEQFEKALPLHRPQPARERQEVPTRILDEDTYPVGGYTSLSNRGSVESLLHSQLAYMEKDDRPDLFDVKFLRDELLYYSRDENQFYRRRRTLAFVLYPDLVHARFKDADLPFQRVVLLLALIHVAIRRLTEWLSTDALRFVFYFVAPESGGTDEPLEDERKLVETLHREAIADQTVAVVSGKTGAEVKADAEVRSRRSAFQALLISTKPRHLKGRDVSTTRLVINGPKPALEGGVPDEKGTEDAWQRVLEQVLQSWVG